MLRKEESQAGEGGRDFWDVRALVRAVVKGYAIATARAGRERGEGFVREGVSGLEGWRAGRF